MKKQLILIFSFLTLCLFSVSFVFAQSTTELSAKKLRFRDYKLAQTTQEIKEEIPEEAPATKPFNIPEWLHMNYTSLVGFDTNPRFSSPKKSDGFVEQIFGVTVDLPIQRLAFFEQDYLSFTYQLDAANYFDYTSVNVFDQTMSWQYRRMILEPIEFSTVYTMDLYRFPDNNRLTFMSNELQFGLTWKGRYIQHGPRYLYIHRKFDKRKALANEGFDSSQDRKDNVHTFQYEILISLWDKIFIQHLEEAFLQRSNDRYQRFDDYGGYRMTTAVTTERVYGFQPVFRLGYEGKEYRQRIVSQGGTTERDDYFFIGFSTFYALNPYCDLGLNYIARHNNSNDPLQEYYSAQITGGIYLVF